jgi:hypothetical protein
VRTATFGRDASEHTCRVVRDHVRAEVLRGIDELHAVRAEDPERTLRARLRRQFA